MRLYHISRKAFKYYKERVKGNRNITYEEARRKLTRNIILASEMYQPKTNLFGCTIYQYGNLKIYTRNNKVIKLKNYKGKLISNWNISKDRYMELNKQLGIK